MLLQLPFFPNSSFYLSKSYAVIELVMAIEGMESQEVYGKFFLHNFKGGGLVMAPLFPSGEKENNETCSLPYGPPDAIVQSSVMATPFSVT